MLFKGNEKAEFSKEFTFWKIILEPMTGNVVTSEVEAEKHVSYEELVGTPECTTL
jgi:hypothetical protein